MRISALDAGLFFAGFLACVLSLASMKSDPMLGIVGLLTGVFVLTVAAFRL